MRTRTHTCRDTDTHGHARCARTRAVGSRGRCEGEDGTPTPALMPTRPHRNAPLPPPAAAPAPRPPGRCARTPGPGAAQPPGGRGQGGLPGALGSRALARCFPHPRCLPSPRSPELPPPRGSRAAARHSQSPPSSGAGASPGRCCPSPAGATRTPPVPTPGGAAGPE